jgi:hypothetical protein
MVSAILRIVELGVRFRMVVSQIFAWVLCANLFSFNVKLAKLSQVIQ